MNTSSKFRFEFSPLNTFWISVQSRYSSSHPRFLLEPLDILPHDGPANELQIHIRSCYFLLRNALICTAVRTCICHKSTFWIRVPLPRHAEKRKHLRRISDLFLFPVEIYNHLEGFCLLVLVGRLDYSSSFTSFQGNKLSSPKSYFKISEFRPSCEVTWRRTRYPSITQSDFMIYDSTAGPVVKRIKQHLDLFLKWPKGKTTAEVWSAKRSEARHLFSSPTSHLQIKHRWKFDEIRFDELWDHDISCHISPNVLWWFVFWVQLQFA